MSNGKQQKYDLSKLKPIKENAMYALYALGYISDGIKKGVRLNKQTGEMVDVELETAPRVRVITLITERGRQSIR